MSRGAFIALTGRPGDKAPIDGLERDPAWTGRFMALPEAISLMRNVGVLPGEQLYRRVMVHFWVALEYGLRRAVVEAG